MFEAAPMDRGTRIVTVVSTLVVAAVGGVGFVALHADGHWGRWVLLAVAFVPAVAFARAPSAYELEGSTFTVRSRWGGTRIFHVADAGVATGRLESLGLRLMGNGGPFGWTGTFTFPARGRAQLYLTVLMLHAVMTLEDPGELLFLVGSVPAPIIAGVAWLSSRLLPLRRPIAS